MSRERDDFYPTPARCVESLLTVEKFSGPIWEPACGDGAISRVLESAGHPVISHDLVDRGFGITGRDFLFERDPAAPIIITNPPFKLASEFILHAHAIGVRHIAMFLRLAFLEGTARHKALWANLPPARVWVFSSRQTVWRGDDPNARATGGTLAFAWFVWRPDSVGTQLGWLP